MGNSKKRKKNWRALGPKGTVQQSIINSQSEIDWIDLLLFLRRTVSFILFSLLHQSTFISLEWKVELIEREKKRIEEMGWLGCLFSLLVMGRCCGRGSANNEDKHSQSTSPQFTNEKEIKLFDFFWVKWIGGGARPINQMKQTKEGNGMESI